MNTIDPEEVSIPVDTTDLGDRKDLLAHQCLNWKNYGNFVAFVLNVLLTYGIGTAGWFGTPDNGELSEKYQTIITPKGSAFAIWAVIFIFQGIFTVMQMLPKYRARPVVQEGVSYWYMITCFAQIGWTFSFAFEINELALFFMLLIWIALMALIISQYYTELDEETTKCCSMKGLLEFWFFKFPFSVHGGWITAASTLNVCVISVDQESSAATQLAIGIICLAVLHALSVWHLFGYKRPNYTIPGVLVWANGWIYGELQEPKQLILDTFDKSIIDGVAYAAFSVAMIISFQIICRVGFFSFNYVKGTSYLHTNE